MSDLNKLMGVEGAVGAFKFSSKGELTESKIADGSVSNSVLLNPNFKRLFHYFKRFKFYREIAKSIYRLSSHEKNHEFFGIFFLQAVI